MASGKHDQRRRPGYGLWRDMAPGDPPRSRDGNTLVFHGVTAHRAGGSLTDQSDELLRKTLRASSDSITISRVGDGRFIEVNDEFERITGYSRREVLGRTSIDLGLWKNPRDRSQLEKVLARDGTARNFEADFVNRDGEVRHCLVSAEVVEIGGEPCMIATVRDVTDQKLAERALEWFNERLEQERQSLAEKEVALRQIIEHLDGEKTAYRTEISAHVKHLLSPLVARLRERGGKLEDGDLDALESHLKRIGEVAVDDFRANFSRLTPREMDICEAIKEGLSSKEIADKFAVSVNTVHKHRQIIRRKLQLNNKEINLAAYLRSR